MECKKKIYNLGKLCLLGIGVAILSTGCSTKLMVDKQIGHLNLESEKLKQAKGIENVVAIVSPSMATANVTVAKQAPSSPLEMMMMQRMGMANNQGYNFTQEFGQNYSKRLEQALEGSMSEILSSKGFKLKGPYATMDDVTYQDKKTIYLAFIPTIDFKIDDKVLKSTNERLYSHREGVIQIGGSLTLTLMEPMTGQVFVKRRINLSDFNIEEPYTYERQTYSGGDSLLDTALEKGTAPERLTDTTDVAITKAINKFYSSTIAKMNQYVDREELLSFENDILKLKGMKRY